MISLRLPTSLAHSSTHLGVLRPLSESQERSEGPGDLAGSPQRTSWQKSMVVPSRQSKALGSCHENKV